MAPADLAPGTRITITLAKTGQPPRRLRFVVERRDGEGWLMENGSRVPDSAPCYRNGRIVAGWR